MATLGSTTKPTSSIEAWSGGTYEIVAVALTLPTGGPWDITKVGVWAAGYAGASCNARVCVWSGAGSLLASSATFTLVGEAFANGNVSLYERSLGPVEVAGGTTVYVGLQVASNQGYQFGRYSSGSHYDAKDTGVFPSSFGSGGSHTPGAGCYLVYESANTAPNAPTNLSPTGSVVVNSGTAPTVSGTRSDPDSGDYITAYQIIVYEDNGTTVIQDTGKISVSGTPTTFSRTLSLNGSHKYVKWKARTWDKENLAGPYSAQQRFYANSVPATPAAPTVSSSSTLTPSFSGSFSDPGDTMAAIQIEVRRKSDSASFWASGDIAKSGTSWTQAYGGNALSWGVTYQVRNRVKDSHGAYSSWSAYRDWTPVQPQGPDNLSPTGTNPRQSSLTPTLTVGHSGNFRNDEVEVRTAAGGGTQLWLKAWDGADYANTTSKARVYAGTALAYGGVYYWRSRIELADGTITAWSDWYPFRINATPNTPGGLTPTGGVVLTTLTPTLAWAFSDPDEDQGDSQTAYSLEVANNATGVVVATLTGTTAESRVYDGAALAYETTYKWRVKATDNMGRESAYSAWQVFKVSQPPVAAAAYDPTVTLATSAAADDIIDTAAAHGYAAGNIVEFPSLTGGAGLSVATPYYVLGANLGATTFQVSTTPTGAPVNFTTDITAGTVRRQVGPGSPVTDSTPQFDWTYSSPGGKAQYSHRVRVYDKGPAGANYADEVLVHDPGDRITPDTFYDVPRNVLVNGHDYRWEVTVKDTDQLVFTLT